VESTFFFNFLVSVEEVKISRSGFALDITWKKAENSEKELTMTKYEQLINKWEFYISVCPAQLQTLF